MNVHEKVKWEKWIELKNSFAHCILKIAILAMKIPLCFVFENNSKIHC